MSILIEDINNAFSPAQEISDPERFVGRLDQIKDAMLALNNRGSFIVVYGLRGVGKSSVALQIKLIAEGNKELPSILNLCKYLPKDGFEYVVYYIKCDQFLGDVPALLKRIIYGDDNNPSLYALTSDGVKYLESQKKTIEASGSFNFANVLKFGGGGRSENSYKEHSTDDLVQQFRLLLKQIQQDSVTKTGLLILIDEFDTLKDKKGFSSLIKTCSSDYIKFGVVGIANTITELVSDHSSIGRQIDSIEVGRMADPELKSIMEKAEKSVRNAISFDEYAKNLIVKQAEGFPYFVHLLGREAMLAAFESQSSVVNQDIMTILNNKIKGGKLKTIYESVYHAAVKSSPQREILLKAFSEANADEIFSEDVYRLVKELGVTNPSQLMKELTTASEENSSPVLIKVRNQYYRFVDPVFKVYAKIRNWKFD